MISGRLALFRRSSARSTDSADGIWRGAGSMTLTSDFSPASAPMVWPMSLAGSAAGIDECKHSLKAVLENPRPTGPTAQALARGDVLRDYVSEVSRNPDPFLEKLGVNVTHRALDQFPSEHPYFTDEQRTEIFGALVFQKNQNARNHDADITTIVMRQRRGCGDRDLFKSRYLVLTRNGLLAQLVRRRCIEMGTLSPTAVPPVIHRRVLAAAMWLRTGLGTQNLEIPKRMLLASCERVLAIRPGVVNAVKKLTDTLGDEEMARQLDLLVAQDRSAQMLMDKTLGAPSVVTEANLPLLFEEMLHPHLEEERKKGKDAVKTERAKGVRKFKEVKGELQTAKEAERDAGAILGARQREDREVVEAFCAEVERKLAKRRIWKRVFGVILAIIFCIPPFLQPSIWQTYLSILPAVLLAFLTITGSKLLGTTTSEEKALSALGAAAKERHLDAKVSRFEIRWKGERFSVLERKHAPADDLFAAESGPADSSPACLNHVIVLNERHLRRILVSYLDYYHRSRTHLSLGKDTPEGRSVRPGGGGKIVAFPQVGGLHHRYERLAA